MAHELCQSTGSLPSSTSDSLSTKSDNSHSVSSVSVNGGINYHGVHAACLPVDKPLNEIFSCLWYCRH